MAFYAEAAPCVDLDTYIAKLTRIEDCFNEYRSTGSVDSLFALMDDENYTELLPKFLNVAEAPCLEKTLQQLKDNTFPIYKLSPYSDIMLHCQRDWCSTVKLVHIAYAYTGSFRCSTGNREFVLTQGNCCMFNANVKKRIVACSEDATLLNCIFSQTYLEKILLRHFDRNMLVADFLTQAFYADSNTAPVLEFNTADNAHVRHSLAMAIYERMEAKPFYSEIVNSYIYLLFSHLLRLYATTRDRQHYMELGNNKLSDILAYIDTHFENVTLTQVAENFHFHPNYLSKIIKIHTNSTFTDILQSSRMKKAAALLTGTDASISEIARQIGYNNISHFYNVFRKEFHCTPADYRKNRN